MTHFEQIDDAQAEKLTGGAIQSTDKGTSALPALHYKVNPAPPAPQAFPGSSIGAATLGLTTFTGPQK